jgi:hypothetical protein
LLRAETLRNNNFARLLVSIHHRGCYLLLQIISRDCYLISSCFFIVVYFFGISVPIFSDEEDTAVNANRTGYVKTI